MEDKLVFIRDIAKQFEPCPFCDDKDDMVFVDITDIGAMEYSVTCNACNVTMTSADLWELLVKWNRRLFTDNALDVGL